MTRQSYSKLLLPDVGSWGLLPYIPVLPLAWFPVLATSLSTIVQEPAKAEV